MEPRKSVKIVTKVQNRKRVSTALFGNVDADKVLKELDGVVDVKRITEYINQIAKTAKSNPKHNYTDLKCFVHRLMTKHTIGNLVKEGKDHQNKPLPKDLQLLVNAYANLFMKLDVSYDNIQQIRIEYQKQMYSDLISETERNNVRERVNMLFEIKFAMCRFESMDKFDTEISTPPQQERNETFKGVVEKRYLSEVIVNDIGKMDKARNIGKYFQQMISKVEVSTQDTFDDKFNFVVVILRGSSISNMLINGNSLGIYNETLNDMCKAIYRLLLSLGIEHKDLKEMLSIIEQKQELDEFNLLRAMRELINRLNYVL